MNVKFWWQDLIRSVHLPGLRLAFLGLVTLISIMLSVLQPWPLKIIIDNVLNGNPLPDPLIGLLSFAGIDSSSSLLCWMVVSTILIFIVNQMTVAFRKYITTGIGGGLLYDLSGSVLLHLQGLSLRFYGRHKTGDLVRRVVTDSHCISQLIMGVCLPLITSLTTLLAMFLIMFRLDQKLAVLAIGVAPFLALLMHIFNKTMTEQSYQHQMLEGELAALAEQTLTSLPAVQAFGREQYEDQRFRRLTQKTLKAYLRAMLAQMQFSVGVGMATALGTAVIMTVGGFQVLYGHLTIGSLTVFLAYIVSLYTPMEQLAYLTATYAGAQAKGRRVIELLQSNESVKEEPGAISFKVENRDRATGHVIFDNVTFGYEQGRPVFQNVTLEANPGEKIGLVGPTGIGKSTLVSLIPRLFDPWSGRVLLGGVDVRKVKLNSLRAQIAFVLQDPFLLPISIAENIAYGRPNASQCEIVSAAQAAQAEGFILNLPHGYDTLIAEQGVTLSGGEKQRLSIARALLMDAPVLILDEPTSSLDGETEEALIEALNLLMRGRTTFIITHRISAIRGTDKIYDLERNRA